MKHTKKRAILSAIAMLIVSTIALSSATYAWFSAGTVVGVDTINANITNNDGSLLISADNSAWGFSLTGSQLDAVETNIMPNDFTSPGTFVPVSGKWGATPSFVDGTINADTHLFSATGNAGNNYIMFKVYLKSTANMTGVTVNPTFSSTKNFVYCGMVGPTSNVIMSQVADDYYPISGVGVTCVDTNGNFIVDDGDSTTGTNPFAASDIGSQVVSSATPQSITLDLVANESKSFLVYVWAEGNDSDCVSGFGTAAVNLTLSIQK